MVSTLSCGCPAAAVVNRSAGPFALRGSVHLPHCSIGKHGHAEARIVLALNGTYETRHGCRRLHVEQGAALYRPAGDEHSDRYAAPTASLSILMPQADAARSGPAPFVIRDAMLGGIAAALPGEMAERDTASSLVLEGLATLLASIVMRRRPLPDRGTPAWIRSVRERLEDDPERTPTLAELAAAVDRDPTHVAATFKRVYGHSAGTYLRHVRLARACSYMQVNAQGSLADVGARCGFSDQSHFTRQFRRLFRITPGQYRRRRR